MLIVQLIAAQASIGMHLHIDKADRIVLPKAVRLQLGLTPSCKLEVVPTSEGVLLRPFSQCPAVRQSDGVMGTPRRRRASVRFRMGSGGERSTRRTRSRRLNTLTGPEMVHFRHLPRSVWAPLQI